MSIQYDVYKNAKDVLKAVFSQYKHRLQTQLQSQGSTLSFILDHFLTVTKSIWNSVQSKLLKNIFNFTIRYHNNFFLLVAACKNGISHKPQNALSVIYEKQFFIL